ncbi:tRNA pseudouridine(38-40) synthase TruA [Haloferacaceae archaeon DSL9]
MRAFRLAYDGRPFHGFQRQPDVPTVEDELFAALRALGVRGTDEDKPDGYAAAGRTDAGVSAAAQTVAFECPDWLTPRAFNSELPGTIRAWAVADAPPDFHATHHAVRREYTYFLYAPTGATLDDRPHVDEAGVRAALSALCGRHDFHNLTPDADHTQRGISGRVERAGDFLVCEVAAGGFSRELVRRLVSVVRAVGTGEMSLEEIDHILGPDHRTGPDGIPPASPTPLVLSGVVYPQLTFEVDETAIESTIRAFGERGVDGLIAGFVNGAVVERVRS